MHAPQARNPAAQPGARGEGRPGNVTHPMKPLEDKLTELLLQKLDINLIETAMVETDETMGLGDTEFYALRDALVSQVLKGGIQVVVKLPSSKALAQQRREAKGNK